jgi:hypothetical protein
LLMTFIQKSQTPTKPKLADQVRIAVRTKHYCLRTEEAYVNWIKRFTLFHNKRHPREPGELSGIKCIMAMLLYGVCLILDTENKRDIG